MPSTFSSSLPSGTIVRTTTADDVLITPGSAETVADAIAQLQSGRAYTLSELYAHIGNTDAHTTPGQMDNIFIALGGLITHLADNEAHPIPGQKQAWDEGAQTAQTALILARNNQGLVTELSGRMSRLEAMTLNDITDNPFLVTFGNLNGLLVTGVWNRDLQRIEF